MMLEKIAFGLLMFLLFICFCALVIISLGVVMSIDSFWAALIAGIILGGISLLPVYLAIMVILIERL